MTGNQIQEGGVGGPGEPCGLEGLMEFGGDALGIHQPVTFEGAVCFAWERRRPQRVV